jgi:hypothetical protein
MSVEPDRKTAAPRPRLSFGCIAARLALPAYISFTPSTKAFSLREREG